MIKMLIFSEWKVFIDQSTDKVIGKDFFPAFHITVTSRYINSITVFGHAMPAKSMVQTRPSPPFIITVRENIKNIIFQIAFSTVIIFVGQDFSNISFVKLYFWARASQNYQNAWFVSVLF